MMLSTTMVSIAANGGGLDIDCSQILMLPETMKEIASAAAKSGVNPRITFRNHTVLMPAVAEEVARLGKGCVVFVV